MRVGVHITGANNMARNLDAAVRGIQTRTEAAVGAAGRLILADAIPRTPIDTGLLRANTTVSTTSNPNTATAMISYHQSYAPYVHERLDARHPVGGAKFLANALYAKAIDALVLIARMLRI